MIRIFLSVFLPFAAGYFLSYLFRVINAVLSETLVAEFSLSASDLGLLTAGYLLGFAALQIPLGILLDQYGPRKIQASLLLVAGLGAVVFAVAESRTGLLMGRTLIGVGVSACLMSAMKSFAEWFPKDRLAIINGFVLTAGGLGAISGSQPTLWLEGLIGWRLIFWGLAICCLLVSALVFFVVPSVGTRTQTVTGLKTQLRAFVATIKTPAFIRVSPFIMFSIGAAMALQGLWAGRFLEQAVSLPRDHAAYLLQIAAIGMTVAYAVHGTTATIFRRVGIGFEPFMMMGCLLFLAVQTLLILDFYSQSIVLWTVFGFVGFTGSMVYARFAQIFRLEDLAKANTAVNLLAFIAAFAFQYLIGTILDLGILVSGNESYGWAEYRLGLGFVWLSQFIALVWFLYCSWQTRWENFYD